MIPRPLLAALLILLALGLSLPSRASAEGAKPSLVVLPFTPVGGETDEGLGYGVQLALEQMSLLHDGLQEFNLGWRVAKIFPGAEELDAYVTGRAAVADTARLGKELGIRLWLNGTVRREGGRLALKAWLHDAETGETYASELRCDPIDGFATLAEDFFALLARAGVLATAEQLARARQPETTSLAGLQALGRASQALLAAQYVPEADRPPLALKPFDAAVHTAPKSSWALNARGWALETHKDFGKARQNFVEAVALRPMYPDALDGLAQCAMRMGEEEEALDLAKRKFQSQNSRYGKLYESIAHFSANQAQKSGDLPRALRILEMLRAKQEQALGAEHHDTLETLNTIGWLHCKMKNYHLAESLLLHVLDVRENRTHEHGDDDDIMVIYLAKISIEDRQYQRAIRLYERSLTYSQKINGNSSAKTFHRICMLAHAYSLSRDTKLFETTYQRIMLAQRNASTNDATSFANSMFMLASICTSMGDYAHSEQLCVRALELFDTAPGSNDPQKLECMKFLARLFFNAGKYDKAEALFVRILNITKDTYGVPLPESTIQMYYLASTYRMTGQRIKAIDLCNNVIASHGSVDNQSRASKSACQLMLASLYSDMGAYAKAENYAALALADLESSTDSNSSDVATAMDALASVYRSTGKYDKAEILVLKALSLTSNADKMNQQSIAILRNSLANIYVITGRHDKAIQEYERAKNIIDTLHGPGTPDSAVVMLHLAVALKLAGNSSASSEILERQALLIALGSRAVAPLQSSLFEQMYSAGDAGQLLTAVFFGKWQVDLIQQVRADISRLEASLQQNYAKQNESTYKFVVDVLLKLGRQQEAMQIMRLLKQYEYTKFTDSSPSPGSPAHRVTFTKAEQQIQSDLSAKAFEWAALNEALKVHRYRQQAEENHTAQLTQLQQRLDDAEKAFNAVLDSIEDILTPTTKRQEPVGQDMRPLVRRMGHGAALVHLLYTDRQTSVMLTTGKAMVSRSSRIARKDLAALLNAYKDSLCAPEADPRPAAKALYDLLIGPIRADLDKAGVRTLLISLTGALRYVPMAALYDGKRFLVEDFDIALVTEAGGQPAATPRREDWRVAGLGVTTVPREPEFDEFQDLPAVEGELRSIVRGADRRGEGVLPGTVRLDGDFTRAALADSLKPGNSVLHIASHFKFASGTDSNSFLLLGDGKLSLAEFRTGPYNLKGVDLLTLSACQTALGGRDATGREVEGLGALAQRMGARSVMATLWPVADASTGSFMHAFYQARQQQGLTKAGALRQAQLSLLHPQKKAAARRADRDEEGADWSHPYYWAPFILMGGWI